MAASGHAAKSLAGWSLGLAVANLCAIGGSTYLLRSHHLYNLGEHEARMDELEGTLRGHIGLIEDALDRLEGKANRNQQEALYSKRGRDDKGKGEGKAEGR